MSSCTIHDVIVPILTPVDEHENVDESSLRRLIRRCLDAGCAGIFAGGSAGSGPLLTDTQWQRLMEIARSEVGAAHTLLAGVIETSTARALQRIRILERIAPDALVITPTFYITLTSDEEILTHFTMCRDATNLPIVAYNIPGCTHSVISPDVVAHMCEQKWLAGVKESSGDWDYFLRVLEIALSCDVPVMQGDELGIDRALLAGAAGCVPVCANYEPDTFVAICRAARDGNESLVHQVQQRIGRLVHTLPRGGENWIASLVYALHTLGIGGDRPVSPLRPISQQRRAQIDAFCTQDAGHASMSHMAAQYQGRSISMGHTGSARR